MKAGGPVLCIACIALASCASAPAPSPPHAAPSVAPVRIELAHGTPAEQATAEHLAALCAIPQVQPFLYTRRVMIDERAVPHSDPVLTLHARYADDNDALLSAFLHEEFHWYLDAHAADTDAAVADLRAAFPPPIPVGFPRGARDERSSYEHLLVLHLERAADRALLGAERTDAVWTKKDYYVALYELVAEKDDAIARIAKAHGLSPTGSEQY